MPQQPVTPVAGPTASPTAAVPQAAVKPAVQVVDPTPTAVPTATPAVTGTAATGTPAVATTSTPPAPLPLTNPAAFAQGVAARLDDLPATDAVHRMTVEVTPEGLGTVKVTAEVTGGALHVSLAGASEAARHALKAAVGDLQRELSGSGFTQTTVDVSTGSGSQQRQSADAQFGAGQQGSSAGSQGRQPGPGYGQGSRASLFATDERRSAARTAAAAADGRLDLSI